MRKKQKIMQQILIIVIAIFLTKSNNPIQISDAKIIPMPSSYTVHGLIDIESNAELDAFVNKTGSGTAESPYIIEDLIIDGGGSNCISIINTNRSLFIRNCNLYGATGSSKAGVRIWASNVTVEKCTIYNCINGIKWEIIGDNCFAQNNTIFDCTYGIYSVYADQLVLRSNYINSTVTGIYNYAEDTVIEQNIIDHSASGIYMYHYAGNIVNNTLNFNTNGVRLRVAEDTYMEITHNTFLNNTNIINDELGGTYYYIWNNTFINNTNAFTGLYNTMNWDKNNCGNYWDDYILLHPTATQDNGIWSEPYNVYNVVYDNYPLVYPFWHIEDAEEEPDPNPEPDDDTWIWWAVGIGGFIFIGTVSAIISVYYKNCVSSSSKLCDLQKKWFKDRVR